MIYIFAVIILSGFFGNYFFALDIIPQFYLQFFGISCLLVFWYFFKKCWVELAIASAFWIFLLTRIIGTDFSGIYADNTVQNPDMFYMNAGYDNKDIDKISVYIAQVKPKQIAIIELNGPLFEKIKKEQDFKYNYYYPDDIYSFGFFTNDESIKEEIDLTAGYPIGHFKTKDRSYFIIHPLHPMTKERSVSQKKLFDTVSNLIKNESNFVLLGEFNSAPYSQVFRSYFGQYLSQSFYSWGKYTLFSLHIDQIVSSMKLNIHPGLRQSSEYTPLLINF